MDAILRLLGLPSPTALAAYAITIALACATAFGAGWMVNGWRLSGDVAEMAGRIDKIKASYATATLKATREADERQQVLTDAIAIIDAENEAERTKANAENSRLRAAVDGGAVSLRVPVRCPAAAPGVPPAAPGGRLDRGTGAELDPAARPDYFALRDGLTRAVAKLAACQQILRAEREIEAGPGEDGR